MNNKILEIEIELEASPEIVKILLEDFEGLFTPLPQIKRDANGKFTKATNTTPLIEKANVRTGGLSGPVRDSRGRFAKKDAHYRSLK